MYSPAGEAWEKELPSAMQARSGALTGQVPATREHTARFSGSPPTVGCARPRLSSRVNGAPSHNGGGRGKTKARILRAAQQLRIRCKCVPRRWMRAVVWPVACQISHRAKVATGRDVFVYYLVRLDGSARFRSICHVPRQFGPRERAAGARSVHKKADCSVPFTGARNC